MFVLEQSDFERVAVSILEFAGFSHESYRTGRPRATGPISLAHAVLIADARAGTVEASHQ
jgi:hypothetical protein